MCCNWSKSTSFLVCFSVSVSFEHFNGLHVVFLISSKLFVIYSGLSWKPIGINEVINSAKTCWVKAKSVFCWYGMLQLVWMQRHCLFLTQNVYQIICYVSFWWRLHTPHSKLKHLTFVLRRRQRSPGRKQIFWSTRITWWRKGRQRGWWWCSIWEAESNKRHTV